MRCDDSVLLLLLHSGGGGGKQRARVEMMKEGFLSYQGDLRQKAQHVKNATYATPSPPKKRQK
jgi:hypothetical protein